MRNAINCSLVVVAVGLGFLATEDRAIGKATCTWAREKLAKTIAKVGQDEKADPRWKGEFCTNDAYGGRFKRDVNYDGLTNFSVVDRGVFYSGSQPFVCGAKDPATGKRGNGWDTLKKIGVTCRILLRSTPMTDEAIDEKKEAEERGIKYVNIPIPLASFGPPMKRVGGIRVPDGAHTAFTALLEKARDKLMEVVTSKKYGPCYVSCQSGRHRTAMVTGWYRAVVLKQKPRDIFRAWSDCQFDADGFYEYYPRQFCRWYKAKFGDDPTCAEILKPGWAGDLFR